MFSLKGKTALVTGASRGIGAAISQRLARAGAHVILLYRSQHEAAQKVLQKIVDDGGSGQLLAVDLLDSAQVEAQLSEVLAQRPISLLVCNAGISKESLVPRATMEHFEEIFKVNFFATTQLVRLVSRSMMKERYGRIVLLSSVIGEMGNKGQAAYAASKSALFGFSKSVAQEFGSRQITCNVICPGFIETEMTDRLPEDLKTAYKERISAARFGSPEDIGAAVHFLVSEEAGYITGSTIDINGGLLMR